MTDIAPPSGWKPVRAEGFMAHIGPLLRSTAPGERHVFALQTGADHRNPLGLVHGGVLTSLLDQAIAILAWEVADRRPTVTLQLDTRFLGVARIGDLLEVRPRLSHATRSLLFLDAEITAGAAPVAGASAIMKIGDTAGATV